MGSRYGLLEGSVISRSFFFTTFGGVLFSMLAVAGLSATWVFRKARILAIFDDVVPIHLEVLLPAFVLGCMLKRPIGHDPHIDDAREGHLEGLEDLREKRVSIIVTAIFMVLVVLSMPVITSEDSKWVFFSGMRY